MFTLTTFIQHGFRSSRHGNQRRKRNKKIPNWKRRNKTVTACKQHDAIHRKSYAATRKLLALINELGKVSEYKINTQKSLASLYTNNKISEREGKEQWAWDLRENRVLLNKGDTWRPLGLGSRQRERREARRGSRWENTQGVWNQGILHQIYVFKRPYWLLGLPKWLRCKESACQAEDAGLIPESGRSPGEGMATHSSILAWNIPWTEEPDGLQSTGSQRIRYNLSTKQQQLVACDFCSGEWKWIMISSRGFSRSPDASNLRVMR